MSRNTDIRNKSINISDTDIVHSKSSVTDSSGSSILNGKTPNWNDD
jgi:hypothetical protein